MRRISSGWKRRLGGLRIADFDGHPKIGSSQSVQMGKGYDRGLRPSKITEVCVFEPFRAPFDREEGYL
jgi:hypothetical protein